MRGELTAALCLTSSAAAQTKATAFVDVTVIATKTGKLAEHQTVIVDGGRIVSVGPANEAKAPAGATRIEGGYLLPGFADLHTHPGRTSDLATYVANGITTIRVMWGAIGPPSAGGPRPTQAGSGAPESSPREPSLMAIPRRNQP
jgi:hypothetical protein